ncbi:MAG: hypothetical protein HOO96_25275 [Polyangiaceae bacterium]|nr:hypothetical protein [Polyangiaceae bacterium]
MTRPRNPGATTADAAVRPKPDDAPTDPGPPPEHREHPSSGRVATARTESLPLIPFRSFAAEVRVREVEGGDTTPGPIDLRGLAHPTADEVAARQHADARPLPKPVDNYHTIPDAKVLLNVTQPPPPSSGRGTPSPPHSSTVPIRRPTERMADVPVQQVLFRERERNQRYVPTGPRLRPHVPGASSSSGDEPWVLRLLSLRGLVATFLVGAVVVVVLSLFVVRRASTPVAAPPSAPVTTSVPASSSTSPAPTATASAPAATATIAAPKPAPLPAKPVHPTPKRSAPPIDF